MTDELLEPADDIERTITRDLLAEVRLRQALEDIFHITQTQDNYGPHTRGKDELQRRLMDCREIASAALAILEGK